MAMGGPIALIGAAFAQVPPVAPAIGVFDIGVFVVGHALVLTGALYHGINCHYPSL